VDYKQKAMIAMGETLKAYTDGDMSRPWVIAYSGGKDSTVVLDIVLRSLMQLKQYNPSMLKRECIIVTAQTHMDFVTDPLKQEELSKIQRLLDKSKLPVKIKEVSAPIDQSFMFLVVGKGYPLPKSKKNRWCTERLKILPSDRAVKELNPEYRILGVRLSESAERRSSIEGRQTSEFYSDNSFMPIVNFTLEDVWSYLLSNGMCWGDAEKLSQLYKDATGECGLRQKKAGRDEKTDDPCGARTGCISCPVVTIDKSSNEFAKHHPQLQPYVDCETPLLRCTKTLATRPAECAMERCWNTAKAHSRSKPA
jgi:DNA sulfur modification protein DndC